MLKRRIVPCLDIRDGRVVKGVKFQGLRDAGDPVELAANYAATGADEIVVLDVSANLEGRAACVETVRRIRRRLSIPLTVGGGVRSVSDAAVLLEAGADKISTNTAAVRDPSLVHELSARFGRQCTVVAIDALSTADGWEVVIASGREPTGIDVLSWAEEVVGRGAGELLVTSFDRDGTRSGYDTALLAALRRRVRVPLIASGGASGAEHMVEAFAVGADAVLAASIFHDGETTVSKLKTSLAAAGVEVRI